MVSVESLARELHEAGRAAVELGATVAAGNFGEKARKFLEWDEITEEAREGRMIQARYLLHRFDIARHPGVAEKHRIEETVARDIIDMAFSKYPKDAPLVDTPEAIVDLCCEISKKYHL